MRVKLFSLVLIIMLCIILVLVSCNSYMDTCEKQDKRDLDRILKETKYFENKNLVFDLDTSNQLVMGDIFIKMEDKTIIVNANGKQFLIEKSYDTGPLSKEHEKLFMAELSPDKKYLAIQINQHEGEKIFVLDLNTGEYQYVNDKEIVGIPRWAPDKNLLAFSVGRITGQKLAIYDPDTKKINELTEAYISILDIKWSQGGDFIDFAAEDPPDTFNLYRYAIHNKKLENLTSITREELVKWDGF